jgi:photosystem II stability/assembly factor-like uncharacterized protein
LTAAKTWTIGKVPGAEKLDFRDVEAFDANTAYLLSIGEGETSRIYKTTDGGKKLEIAISKYKSESVFRRARFLGREQRNGDERSG